MSPEDKPPIEADSGTADSGTADSRTADSGTADSRTADSRTADSRTAEAEAGDSRTADSRTADSRTADSRTAEAEAADSRTADSRTADSRTAEAEAGDEPILPAHFELDLSHAIGLDPHATRPRFHDDDDDDARPKRGRRTMVVGSLSIIVGLSIAALVFLGRANAERFLVVCTSDHVDAEQGRAFPPWGSHPLAGAEWRPIALPPNAECKARETDDLDELAHWYLDVLIDRASTALTARNLLETVPPHAAEGAQGPPTPLDLASTQLDQALLLARAPERRDQRKEIERLLGDVEYWRAAARLRDASAALLDAAKQFETAATQRPRHVTDAAAWATFVRRLADELRAGPNATPAPVAPPHGESNAPAPPGVALPIEPPTTGSDNSATAPAAPAPDAGVPGGGVLL